MPDRHAPAALIRRFAALVAGVGLVALAGHAAAEPLEPALRAAGHDPSPLAAPFQVIKIDSWPGLAIADPAGGSWRFEGIGLLGGRCSGDGELEVLGGQPLLVRARVDVELAGTDACLSGNECPCAVRREDHLYAIDRFTGAILGQRIVVIEERFPDDSSGGRAQVEVAGEPARGDFATLVRRVESPATTKARAADEARVAALVKAGRELARRGDQAQAIARFDEALAVDPWIARAWSGRGYARLQARRDLERARQDFEIALLLDASPSFQGAVWFNLATVDDALGEHWPAHVAFERCAALGNRACIEALAPR